MKFKDYTPNEREQWLKDDITQSYVEFLRGLMADSKDALVGHAREGRTHASAHCAGLHEGVEFAIRAAEIK